MTLTSTPSPAVKEPADHGRKTGRAEFLVGIGGQNISLIGALVLVLVLFGILNDNYLSLSNMQVIAQAATITGLLAIVQTVVIICGGLDISVGSQTGVASVISAMAFTSVGSNAFAGMAAAVGIGVLIGLANGLIIVYGRVNPTIATLAGLAAYKGLAQLLSDGRAQGYVLNNDAFIFLGRGKIVGLPVMVWLLVIVAAAVHLLLKYTDIGRNLYAIGGNDTAARLAGISINKYLVAVYALIGVVAAVAGILLTARTGSGQPTSGSEGLELKAITAAALGGCALKGGKGGIGGTLLAVALLGCLENGLTVEGINSFWQNVAQGALLVVAVVIQQRRSGERAVGLPH
ncbi:MULTISPECIES: ABC transporter permease [unclassified Streptomyces]|uniref:ABC transporter permease n=1 Tax=unclassified Streptomyces TaxID=2593676 RepID=UPI00225A6EF2|nr:MULTISPECIES: ABC transporter permease [unclassified Streptomyces]WSP59367.1 ABC transporter permease [Streptomyces sp. NBC_01241]WSU20115.1 ABC transporter permease [Streptomyces sp. NBC_01108]MCX4791128.1 ABC transporter permease [Streptomyces sp. NBC_01221]MCX4793153.1 ABC transporter permease [Streptomyces sp. NBC_01242]WSP61042.1 ABC transporter permease [Streptomyces sp. NBC_01240]